MGAVRRLGDTRTALLHLDRLRDIARILNKSKEGFFKLSASTLILLSFSPIGFINASC